MKTDDEIEYKLNPPFGLWEEEHEEYSMHIDCLDDEMFSVHEERAGRDWWDDMDERMG
jgi:hypothetical protein